MHYFLQYTNPFISFQDLCAFFLTKKKKKRNKAEGNQFRAINTSMPTVKCSKWQTSRRRFVDGKALFCSLWSITSFATVCREPLHNVFTYAGIYAASSTNYRSRHMQIHAIFHSQRSAFITSHSPVPSIVGHPATRARRYIGNISLSISEFAVWQSAAVVVAILVLLFVHF